MKNSKSKVQVLTTQLIDVTDAYGRDKQLPVAGEYPLTIYLNRKEIVTLMTMGSEAYFLVLGYLLNQRLLSDELAVDEIDIQIDWSVKAAAVKVPEDKLAQKIDLHKKTITSGCGQGTVYGDLLEDLDARPLPDLMMCQSQIYQALYNLLDYNDVYRRAGGVHACALLDANQQVVYFVEDVGRHNAADAINGKIWSNKTQINHCWFYTTGRLTSEMVIKSVQMGIPVLLSRSGVTSMGIDLAKKYNVILIARAKGHYFIVYNGSKKVILDASPRELNPRELN